VGVTTIYAGYSPVHSSRAVMRQWHQIPVSFGQTPVVHELLHARCWGDNLHSITRPAANEICRTGGGEFRNRLRVASPFFWL